MGRFPNGDRPSRKRLAAPDRLVGSGHPLSVSRDRIRYAPGTVTALTRSADAAGVPRRRRPPDAADMGRHPDLGRWRAAFPPLVLLAPLALAPAFVARGYFVRVLTAGIATGNADGAPPFVAWNELYRNGQVRAFECRPPRAARAWGRARSARSGALGNGLVDPRPSSPSRSERPSEAGAWRPSARSRAGSSGRSPRRISSRSRTSGRRRSRRSPRPDASATAFTRAASAVSLAPARTPPPRGGGRNAGRWLHAGWPVRPARSRRRARLRRPRRRARSVRAGCGDGAGSGRCGRRRRSDRSDRGGSGPRRSIGRPRTPPTPEVPPMVQTGRSVPLGRTGVRETGAGGTRAGRARVDDSVPDGPGGAVGADGGFDWNAPDGKSVDRDGVSPDDTASGEFEWDVDVDDREDKN